MLALVGFLIIIVMMLLIFRSKALLSGAPGGVGGVIINALDC